ncbi:arylesterase [Polymorphobacter arshaanensis]|uniref:Arylesterase n=1 Tax=Glacieibacterium arshaanense TaxID=2511025 RepID=A0A4Y9EQ10_9SPHN|nr:arylesterase [Polymorphobacter arshaanensis]TFU05532.1 arylesterase [Polymorphobacter arshaanensis]
MRPLYQLALLLLVVLVSQAVNAAPKLVLGFGDSLMAGYQLKPAESFPAQLQVALDKAGRDVTVKNAGVSGDTSTAGRARLNWVLAGLGAKPDLVILELGANDMLRGQDPAITRANLDAMLTELGKRKIPVILAGMRASPNLGAAYTKPFDAMYAALAAKHKVRLYPFFLDGVAATPKLQLADGMHPNAAGVAVIVKRILPTVEAALGPK